MASRDVVISCFIETLAASHTMSAIEYFGSTSEKQRQVTRLQIEINENRLGRN